MEFGRCLQRMATCTRDAWRRDGFPTRRARADNPRMGNGESVANRGSGQTQQVVNTAGASRAEEARTSSQPYVHYSPKTGLMIAIMSRLRLKNFQIFWAEKASPVHKMISLSRFDVHV